MFKKLLLASAFVIAHFCSFGQNLSIAYEWNNLILEAIRNDYARPTVHARNLYHHSIIAYDAWAAYDLSKQRFFLGDTLHGYVCNFDGVSIPADVQAAREEAISYASFRFIQNRYVNSPDYAVTYNLIVDLMNQLGYDISITSTDYVNGGPAELGNYLAEQIQLYGYTDGSNEQNNFENIYYDQMNPPLVMSQPGNPDIQDRNHWQPLTLTTSIDQSGNLVSNTQPHLSPEWGDVDPFALDTTMYTEHTRNGDTYKVYFDTVHPAFLYEGDSTDWNSFYKWNHTLVSVWQSHLDTSDGVMWDISPASSGNNTWYPSDSSEFPLFYDLLNGGDPGAGYALNPVTGLPYTPQIVPRADYARVLAEFWADGIDSETPPGHWFEIYHYVMQQPSFVRKWKGVGPVLDPLEYDVKAQLALGGTVHDAAICAWSLKGYYDYIRPVSAIRSMADLGQSSDTLEMSYHPDGIPLLPGYVEVVHIGDSLAGQWNENVGKIKLYTWRGHDYIIDPAVDDAGVGWILAENWWPYQRPTFVTPPFAGFVSGHSTFSRAAANTMEFMTGSPFFPGGMGEFVAIQNEYLQFEEGPSQTITLQWATYKDASDQCSLSRIWGGIHPPVDDMPGRMIGEEVGQLSFNFADSIFSIGHPALIATVTSDSMITIADIGGQFTMNFEFNVAMDTSVSPALTLMTPMLNTAVSLQQIIWVDSFNVMATFDVPSSTIEIFETDLVLSNILTGTGTPLTDYSFHNHFMVDTKKPNVSSVASNYSELTDAITSQSFEVYVSFDEPCDTTQSPTLNFTAPGLVNPTLTLNNLLSNWVNDTLYKAHYMVTDFNETVQNIQLGITTVADVHGNPMNATTIPAPFMIDTENPGIIAESLSDTLVSQVDLSSPVLTANITFSEAMNTSVLPDINFLYQGTVHASIVENQTIWTDTNIVHVEFLIFSDNNDLISLDLSVSNAFDSRGNILTDSVSYNVIQSDMKSPEVINASANKWVISDSLVGNNGYYVDIVFGEPMDTVVKPLVMHTASQNITGTIQYNLPLSTYLDSTTYRAYYQIIDQNIDEDIVDLEVKFGEDYAGNTQTIHTQANFCSIDTKNPSVIGVFANDYILDQLGQSFEVLTLYDEPMFTGKHPVLTFTPSPTAPLSIPLVDSLWINSTNHTLYYELQSSPTQSTLFDIDVNAAVDLAGNVLEPLFLQDFVQIDPALGINELAEGKIHFYPTLVASGAQLTLVGEGIADVSENDFTVHNALGQKVGEISFGKTGNKLVSEPVTFSPGMYYLTFKEYQLKFIMK